MSPLLRTERLTKAFGALRAVDGGDLAVEAGSLHSVIGPNGRGDAGRAPGGRDTTLSTYLGVGG